MLTNILSPPFPEPKLLIDAPDTKNAADVDDTRRASAASSVRVPSRPVNAGGAVSTSSAGNVHLNSSCIVTLYISSLLLVSGV